MEEEGLLLASMNVNGVRAFARVSGGLSGAFGALGAPAVLALQETRLLPEDAASARALAAALPSHELFHAPSALRRGYSGVAVLARRGLVRACRDWFDEPDDLCSCPQVQHKKRLLFSLSFVCSQKCAVLKQEGRVLLLDMNPNLLLICVYVPNGGKEKDPTLPSKSEFLRRLSNTIARHRALGKSVILLGDLNIVAHKRDIWYDAIDFEKKRAQGEPCMSESVTTWLQTLLSETGGGMVDSFRFLHPGLLMRCFVFLVSFFRWADVIKFSWFDAKTFGRETGKGWRLDYALVSQDLKDLVLEGFLFFTVLFFFLMDFVFQNKS